MAAPSPGRRLLRRPLVRTTLAAGLLAASIVPLGAAPAAADHDAPCLESEVPGSERLADTHAKDNPAFERMHVEQAQELATGRGVKVAVIDSGMVGIEGLDVAGGLAIEGVNPGTRLSGHGTIVAGLIAGPRGVAPDAQVFDVKVYDTDDADTTQGEKGLSSAGIAAGIDAVIAAQPQQQFDVVNISLAVREPDPELEAAVARLVDLGVVVVAAAGNVPVGTADSGFAGTPDNDADVFPADYPGVLAVSATPPGDESPSAYVVPNLDTDVAAPTLGCDLGQRHRSGLRRRPGRDVVGERRGQRGHGPAQASASRARRPSSWWRGSRRRPRARAPSRDRTARRPTRGPVRVSSRRTTRSPGRSGRAARARWRPPSRRSGPTPRRRPRPSASTSSARRARSSCGRGSSPGRSSRSPSCCARCCDVEPGRVVP